ncbi:nuclear transport factor 2 family protein [Aldersonia sp. NBC_00410]|uniref:nuclear transport factor 2 family protein n=1 Tax=Aldersonia sp. NBC_00410 TaxID=2975954 RepID=UPI00225753D7|nr:nuclear transport factor 2 family protein [Aldersonia sp. NBC_00410]MCX5042369.1 nuclear transport factor 2 family protein [Aldersonia sp. NBC_00410]
MTRNITAHPSELEITRDLLEAADTDIARFFGYFSEDCTFRMGNNDTIRGSRAIQKWVASYLGAVAGMRHVILEEWPAGAVTALRVDVTYTMNDGAEFTLPAVTRTRVEDGKVTEYLIFMDPGPVTAGR